MNKKSKSELNIPTERIVQEANLTQLLAISLAADEDPVTAAEQAVGVGRNQLDPATELSLALRYNRMKADQAEWEEDTFFGMGWKYLLGVLQKQGFEQVYAHDFQEPRHNNLEEFIIWVRRDKGFLVSADSYWQKDTVHSAHLYYELTLPSSYESLTEEQRNFIWKLGGSRNALIVNGSIAPALFYQFDGRERLVRELRKLEAAPLSTNVTWKNVLPDELNLLQLYDFASAIVKEAENYREDQYIKNKRTLDKLPEDIQKMVGWIV